MNTLCGDILARYSIQFLLSNDIICFTDMKLVFLPFSSIYGTLDGEISVYMSIQKFIVSQIVNHLIICLHLWSWHLNTRPSLIYQINRYVKTNNIVIRMFKVFQIKNHFSICLRVRPSSIYQNICNIVIYTSSI